MVQSTFKTAPISRSHTAHFVTKPFFFSSETEPRDDILQSYHLTGSSLPHPDGRQSCFRRVPCTVCTLIQSYFRSPDGDRSQTFIAFQLNAIYQRLGNQQA